MLSAAAGLPRRRGSSLLLLGVVAVLAAGGRRGRRQSAQDRSGGRLLRLGPGDQMTVRGNEPPLRRLGIGRPDDDRLRRRQRQSPRPGSYSFAVADTALLVLKASASSTPVQVKREAEPAGSGATYPGPADHGQAAIRATVGTVATVGGTHIFCAVERLQAKTYVTCGPADGSARFFVKSYVGAVSAHDIFVIRKLDQKRTKTVFQHRQP